MQQLRYMHGPDAQAAVDRLITAGVARWRNPAVKNRVVSTRPAKAPRPDNEGDALW